MKNKYSSHSVSKHRGAAIPTWLVLVGILGLAVWQGWINLPTQSLATQANGLTTSCQLQAGQTLSTVVTASALDFDKPDGLVTVNAVGAIDGAEVAFAGLTGTTADKGSGVAVLLTNTSTYNAKVTGALPCDRDNFQLGSLVGGAKVGLTGGFSNTTQNSAGTVAGNETIGASGVGFWTMRMSGNRTSAYTTGGTSTGYLTNPDINKFGLILDISGGGSCVGTLDTSQMTATFKGASCSQKSYKFAGNNGFEVGFECPGNLDVYAQGDAVFRLPAVSGQNPACVINGLSLAYDYAIQNEQLVETPETLTGTLVNNGQGGFFTIYVA